MSLTGLPLLLLSAVATVVVTAGTVWLWRRRRLAVRIAGVLLIEALVVFTVGLQVNRNQQFYPRPERAAWGLTGYSAGAFCAINLLLRHPGQYAAAAGLSGYSSPGIKIGDGSERTTNNPGWRLGHLPQPAVALWLGWAADDKASARESRRMAKLARAPLSVTTAVVAHGGHSDAVWLQMEGPSFDWLAAHVARPTS